MSHQSDPNKEKVPELGEPDVILIGASPPIQVIINEPISQNPSCSVDSDRCVASCKLHYCTAIHHVHRIYFFFYLDASNQVYSLESGEYPEPAPTTEKAEYEKLLENKTAERIRIRTRDLICWSFQIASGMNHLAKKKVYLFYLLILFSNYRHNTILSNGAYR